MSEAHDANATRLRMSAKPDPGEFHARVLLNDPMLLQVSEDTGDE